MTIYGLDFDGTCVSHEFPEVGNDIKAVPVLKKLTEAGHKLILFTMRGSENPERNYLQEAIDWFDENGIPLFGIQTNPTQKNWTNSPKAYAQVYIDDAAFGGYLLKSDPEISKRPFIDWDKVEAQLIKDGEISG